MKTQMNDWIHSFVILDKKENLHIVNQDHVIFIHNYAQLYYSPEIRKLVTESNKVIISGVFGAERYMSLYSDQVWKKVYLHFWGGDFYRYGVEKLSVKRQIAKHIMEKCILRSAGIITLIEEDFEKIDSIFPNNKKHLKAPVPADPLENLDYEKCYKEKRSVNEIKIVLGNSATPENHHEEMMKVIADWKLENIEVYCPLSYGMENYKNDILKLGNDLLGQAFKPMEDFLPKNEYVTFLSNMDVGIFNNDRQQAMGNIWILLAMGKKVYIRKDTSMWHYFTNEGIVIFSVEELKNASEEMLKYTDFKGMDRNITLAQKHLENGWRIKDWEKVLND